ncbi:DNL zinc finger-domain-containing protein, partial [Thelephora terrestris]
EPKYSLTFTCKVPECDERTSHMFSKRAYHHGIVIIQCPKCENRHLIADNLGWFKDERTGQGSLRNIEDIMRSKGQQVTKGRLDAGGVVEYTE